MAILTNGQVNFFQENGYLVCREMIPREWTEEALDLVWENLDAERSDPASWVDQGYKTIGGVGGSDIVKRIVREGGVHGAAQQLVGAENIYGPGGASPHISFPRSNKAWSIPARGHLDGYYTPHNGVTKGTTGRFMVAATIYIDTVDHKGGGFTLWPGSHRLFAEYFRTHPIDGPQGGVVDFSLGEPYEFTGGPGDVCFWHGWISHTASTNAGERPRMALITRISRKDQDEWKFDTADGDLWSRWEGVESDI